MACKPCQERARRERERAQQVRQSGAPFQPLRRPVSVINSLKPPQ